MLRTTSIRNRARFSRVPPYSSVRWFRAGERNWLTRKPWAAWSWIASQPACLAHRAARVKAETMFAMSSWSMARQAVWPSFATAEGPIGFKPVSAESANLPAGRIREFLVNGGIARLFLTCCSEHWVADQMADVGSNGGDMPALRLGAGTGREVTNFESRGLTNRHFGAQP